VAQSVDSGAMDDGIDVWLDWESPKAWAKSVANARRSYIDCAKFPEEMKTLHEFDTVEGLFSPIFPDWRRTGL
jgi:hypothetical protein